MTGSITFSSVDEFETDYMQALQTEVEKMADDHSWWHEPISLTDDPKNQYRLFGSQKILRRYLALPDGQLRKIDYRDDVLLGMVDYLATVEMLTYLSKEHEFEWSFGYPADPRYKEIGRIENGEISPKIFEFLLPEMDALEITDKELEDEALHARLRAKHLGA